MRYVGLPDLGIAHWRHADDTATNLNNDLAKRGIKRLLGLLRESPNGFSESALQPAISLRHV
ncbi:hypothetical protein D3C77_688220 [compost metagenome]